LEGQLAGTLQPELRCPSGHDSGEVVRHLHGLLCWRRERDVAQPNNASVIHAHRLLKASSLKTPEIPNTRDGAQQINDKVMQHSSKQSRPAKRGIKISSRMKKPNSQIREKSPSSMLSNIALIRCLTPMT